MKWTEVVQDCSQAVELNPRYIKALFRRAKALEKLDNKKECLEGKNEFLKKKKMFVFQLNLKMFDVSSLVLLPLFYRRHSSVYPRSLPEPTEHVTGRQGAKAAGKREG